MEMAVHQGKADPTYQDPTAFFQRTFITEDMRLLLTSVAQRLNGGGGDPVMQLQTAFGGGILLASLPESAVRRAWQPSGRLKRPLAGCRPSGNPWPLRKPLRTSAAACLKRLRMWLGRWQFLCPRPKCGHIKETGKKD